MVLLKERSSGKRLVESVTGKDRRGTEESGREERGTATETEGERKEEKRGNETGEVGDNKGEQEEKITEALTGVESAVRSIWRRGRESRADQIWCRRRAKIQSSNAITKYVETTSTPRGHLTMSDMSVTNKTEWRFLEAFLFTTPP